SSPSPDSSAPHQRRCEVRGRLPRMPPFVQACESGEVSRGAGRRLLETSNREQTRQSRSDALRTVQGIVVGRIIKVGTPRPFGTPWMCHEDRTPTHGYELTREAAMAAVRE